MSGITAPVSDRRRLGHLDGLRGVAALIVTFHHFTKTFQVAPWAYQTPLLLFLNGHFSVFVFFTLSGFVLAQSASGGKRTLPIRIVARYFRLTVPMGLSILFAWVLLHLFPTSRVILGQLKPSHWLETYSYGAVVPGFGEALKEAAYKTYFLRALLFNNVVWTMAFELKGSIGIYVFYRYCAPRYRTMLLGIITLLLILRPTYLGFAIGPLFRELWIQDRLRNHPLMWVSLVAGLAISILSVVETYNNAYEPLIFSFGAALVVLSVITLEPLHNILSSPVPQFLGKISFALYLIHVPLALTVVAWIYLAMPEPESLKIGVAFAAFMLLSVGLAWLATIFIDEPLMKSLHRLDRLMPAKSTAPAAARPAAE